VANLACERLWTSSGALAQHDGGTQPVVKLSCMYERTRAGARTPRTRPAPARPSWEEGRDRPLGRGSAGTRKRWSVDVAGRARCQPPRQAAADEPTNHSKRTVAGEEALDGLSCRGAGQPRPYFSTTGRPPRRVEPGERLTSYPGITKPTSAEADDRKKRSCSSKARTLTSRRCLARQEWRRGATKSKGAHRAGAEAAAGERAGLAQQAALKCFNPAARTHGAGGRARAANLRGRKVIDDGNLTARARGSASASSARTGAQRPRSARAARASSSPTRGKVSKARTPRRLIR